MVSTLRFHLHDETLASVKHVADLEHQLYPTYARKSTIFVFIFRYFYLRVAEEKESPAIGL